MTFFVMAEGNEEEAASPQFVTRVAKAYADAAPVMNLLCAAVEAEF